MISALALSPTVTSHPHQPTHRSRMVRSGPFDSERASPGVPRHQMGHPMPEASWSSSRGDPPLPPPSSSRRRRSVPRVGEAHRPPGRPSRLLLLSLSSPLSNLPFSLWFQLPPWTPRLSLKLDALLEG